MGFEKTGKQVKNLLKNKNIKLQQIGNSCFDNMISCYDQIKELDGHSTLDSAVKACELSAKYKVYQDILSEILGFKDA